MAQFPNQYGQPHIATRTADQAIDAGLRQYMLKVYNYMALGVAATAAVTLLLMSNPQVMAAVALGPMKWVLLIAFIGIGWFGPSMMLSSRSAAVAHAFYWAYAAIAGAILSPMIFAFFKMNLGHLVFRAFALSALMFAATSLYGYVTKRDLSGWGSFLTMATIGLLIVMLGHLLFAAMGWLDAGTSKMLSFVISCVAVLIFAALSAYETQEIKQMYVETDGSTVVTQKAIFGAFLLYGTFIVMFSHLLNILGYTSRE
jgi:hypothetical protein